MISLRPKSTLGTVFLFLHGACVGLSRIRTTCHHPTGYHHHPAGLILGGRERLHAVTFTIHHRSRSMDRRGVGGATHTALIFSTSSSLLYSFFKGEAAAAVSSSSSPPTFLSSSSLLFLSRSRYRVCTPASIIALCTTHSHCWGNWEFRV